MITVLGGTFSRLHKGHKLMIRAAFETGNRVIVGLTTDEYLRKHKAYGGYSYSARRRNLRRFMSSLGDDFEIVPLGTRSGNTETSPEYEAIVVSKETEKSANSINRKRMENGLKPLRVITVPIVMAEDLFPMSSSRIISGEIRTSGTRIQPVRVGISTQNSLKEEALEIFLRRLMKNFQVEVNGSYSLETDQPFGRDTNRLATRRAMEALSDRDYGVGIESGVWREPVSGKYVEQHVCVVIDRYSRVTMGNSSGFELPDNLISHMKEGKNESDAFAALYGIEDLGKSGGVVSQFSKGRVLRMDLILESVRNAFIPRLGAEYFGLDRKP